MLFAEKLLKKPCKT